MLVGCQSHSTATQREHTVYTQQSTHNATAALLLTCPDSTSDAPCCLATKAQCC